MEQDLLINKNCLKNCAVRFARAGGIQTKVDSGPRLRLYQAVVYFRLVSYIYIVLKNAPNIMKID